MESTRSPDVKRRPMPGKGTRTIVVPSIVLTSLVVISVAAVPMARPQPEARTQGQFERSVLDGVYTEDQAFRGEDAFVANCEGCHIYGEPDDAAPPLLDNSFLDNWREDTLGPLFEHMRTRMPSQAPGSLTDLTYLDILSYILWEHGMPFGEQELTEDAARSTQLVGLDGPQPFPNLALLGVVGCLGRSDDRWILARASAVRIRSAAAPFNDEELATARATPSGPGTYFLQNSNELATANGQMVQVRGVLVRQFDGEYLSVIMMNSVAPACEPD